MNRIAQRRSKRTRYVITDDHGRYFWRHWSGRWEWTTNRHDARIFRSQGAAVSRASQYEGARVVPLTG